MTSPIHTEIASVLTPGLEQACEDPVSVILEPLIVMCTVLGISSWTWRHFGIRFISLAPGRAGFG